MAELDADMIFGAGTASLFCSYLCIFLSQVPTRWRPTEIVREGPAKDPALGEGRISYQPPSRMKGVGVGRRGLGQVPERGLGCRQSDNGCQRQVSQTGNLIRFRWGVILSATFFPPTLCVAIGYLPYLP